MHLPTSHSAFPPCKYGTLHWDPELNHVHHILLSGKPLLPNIDYPQTPFQRPHSASITAMPVYLSPEGRDIVGRSRMMMRVRHCRGWRII